jgi:hypothetical protein
MEAARQDTRTTVLLICAAFDAQVLINADLATDLGRDITRQSATFR